MTIGKTITLGVLVGITAYLALIAGWTLFGVKVSELGQFPEYVGCLAELDVLEADTLEKCREWRTYYPGEDGDPSHVERLAARFVAAANRFIAAVRGDVDQIVAVWVDPIVSRLKMAGDVVKDVFAP